MEIKRLLKVVVPDQVMILDGTTYNFDFAAPPEIWAIHWDATKDTGIVELADGGVENIDNLDAFAKLLSALASHLLTIPPSDLHIQTADGDWILDLDKVRNSKIVEINAHCAAEIVAGFESSALGSMHRYQSDRDDQTNLLGLVAADTDLPLKCQAVNVTDWSYLLHTAAQLKLALRDGANHKLQLLQRCNDIKLRIKNAQTLDAIQAEVWAEE